MSRSGKAPFGRGAQTGIGADAAADADLLNCVRVRCGSSLVDEHVHHGLLKGSGQVGQYLRRLHVNAFGGQFLGEVEDGGFESGEAEVIAMIGGMAQPARERIARGIASLRSAFDGRPAGEAKVEQASDLIKRLAGGIVKCAAQPLVAAVGGHQHQFGVAA